VQILQSQAMQNLEVRGTEYPPGDGKVFASRCVMALQFAVISLIFGGNNIFQTLKVFPSQAVSDMVSTMSENKMMSFMGVWLLGNVIQGSLLSTGAFEIHHGDQLLWSSLEEKRLPNMGDLVTAFKSAGVELMASSRDGA